MPLMSVFKETPTEVTTDKQSSLEIRSVLLPLQPGATVGTRTAFSKTITILERALGQK